jgi:hypothetical protein
VSKRETGRGKERESESERERDRERERCEEMILTPEEINLY